MSIETWERVVQVAGFGVLAAAWASSGLAAFRGAGQAPGRTSGLAGRLRAHTVYVMGAVPYFALCVWLWEPLPWEPEVLMRATLLVAGLLLGVAGAAFYFLGRRELGAMYNVSSSLGSELYQEHQLVTTGIYAWCRHPMYVGLGLAALGGLAVYRTWTLVFMLGSLLGAVLKARAEDALLEAEFGGAWRSYADQVHPWIPRRPRKEVSHVG